MIALKLSSMSPVVGRHIPHHTTTAITSVVLHRMRHHSSGQWQTWCQQRHNCSRELWPNKSHLCFSWLMLWVQTLSCCPTFSQCTLVLLSESSPAYLSHRFLHCTQDVLLCATVFFSSLASFLKFICRPKWRWEPHSIKYFAKRNGCCPKLTKKTKWWGEKKYYTHCTDEES